jgi:hypothetical protein
LRRAVDDGAEVLELLAHRRRDKVKLKSRYLLGLRGD